MVVGSTSLCGHTNFVFGLKLGCDNNHTKVTAQSSISDVDFEYSSDIDEFWQQPMGFPIIKADS